jgi:prepilin-type N-terminal cleavage/methylation domain-containing protein
MKAPGYSLVEVLVAAAVVAVGLTAAAMLVSTLMQQQELNAATLRAANVQEQAAKLFRLDVSPALIREILPEVCVSGSVPPAGGYSVIFSRLRPTNIMVDDTAVSLEAASLQLIYQSPLGAGTLGTNVVPIVRPSIRVEYNQD